MSKSLFIISEKQKLVPKTGTQTVCFYFRNYFKGFFTPYFIGRKNKNSRLLATHGLKKKLETNSVFWAVSENE